MLYLIVSETLDESEENVTIFTDVLAADSTFRHKNPRPITNEQVRCATLGWKCACCLVAISVRILPRKGRRIRSEVLDSKAVRTRRKIGKENFYECIIYNLK